MCRDLSRRRCAEPVTGDDPQHDRLDCRAMRAGRALTSAPHARIRLHLALIPVYIALVWGWADLARRLPVGPGSEANRARDFAAIAYIPGQIANQGDASVLYDFDRRTAMLRDLL